MHIERELGLELGLALNEGVIVGWLSSGLRPPWFAGVEQLALHTANKATAANRNLPVVAHAAHDVHEVSIVIPRVSRHTAAPPDRARATDRFGIKIVALFQLYPIVIN